MPEMLIKPHKSDTFLTRADLRRRKREIIMIAVIVFLVGFLIFAESRLVYFSKEMPVSNSVLVYILININLLLLILLFFLVVRNIVKLLLDRKRKVMGSRLRTRLIVAFISLTLLPTGVLFIFSINFISNSIAFWFNVPVEQALVNSLDVGRRLYTYVEERNRFFAGRVSYQVHARNYLAPENREALERYLEIVRREFDLDAVEVYGKDGVRLALFREETLGRIAFEPLSVEVLRNAARKGATGGSLSQETPLGELIRVAETVPFNNDISNADGYVVLTALISADLVENLAAIARGIEEYRQIKLLKRPVEVSNYIILSVVALLVVFCAIWFGFYLAKSISIPIKELAEGTRRVAEGDLSVTIAQVGDDEIGSLVEAFNRMTAELQTNRTALEQSARMLREQNIELENRRRFMEIVLKNVSTGVITLDAGGRIMTVNTSAEEMLAIEAEQVTGSHIGSLLVEDEHRQLSTEVRRRLESSLEDGVRVGIRLTINGRPRSFATHFNALRDDTGRRMGLVVVFDDLTEQEKAQRMAAWREVARRIAHEVKNPLTPISLSAQRLKRKYSERIAEPVFDECTRMIIDHVELIRNLVNEFSAFAKFPTADPKPCDLAPVIEESVALYREGLPDIHFDLNLPAERTRLNLDRQQIKQAMINLIDNAVAAMKRKGTLTISVSPDPVLKIVRLEVADDGPGIADADKIRLFEPHFSTKTTGMGLGLTIVNTIVADHNGMIRVQDNHPRGTKFVIELPA